MRTPIVIDATSGVALRRQIYDAWRQAILSGHLPPGAKVPSTRELAQALPVARTTVSAAYDQLIAEGYLESRCGAGTFVCSDVPDLLVPSSRAPADEDAPSPVRLSEYGRRVEAPVARVGVAPGTIDLSKYSPDLSRFPFDLWRRLISRHLREATPAVFDYAENGAGLPALRREIAAYVGRSRAVRCTPDQVIVVNGSQQALDLCARVLINPRDEVAVENPGYPGARLLFAAHGADVKAVRVDGNGLVVSALPKHARIVHVTPSHQFPTGVPLSLGRRLELLDWARRRNAVIVEDDYDNEYRYRGAPLPALQGLTRAVRVVYVGTFSNVMFPGLRIGYAILPQDLVETFARAKWASDRHTTLLEQAALAAFIRDGHLDRHVRRMRRVYGRRRDALVQALDQHFGRDVSIRGDAAGMYLLARFGSRDVIARTHERRVALASTARYYALDPPEDEYILRFSALSERALREGVKRLAG
jgi:GntR family transcriptional regulator/MocR family aminotransferase